MRVLLLNANYLPLEAVSWKKALVLWYRQRVEPLEFYEDWEIGTTSGPIKVPSVIRLKELAQFKRIIRFSREIVFMRDNYMCRYCGHKSSKLTFDHVIPRSKGGKTVFENIVACCSPCNAEKGDLPLAKTRFVLSTPPRTPTQYQIIRYNLEKIGIQEEWENYLF